MTDIEINFVGPDQRLALAAAGFAQAAAVSAAENVAAAVQPLIDEATEQAEAAAASAAAAAASATAAAGFVSGIMYPDTATGLAATAANGYFVVVGNGADTYATLYQDVAGVAVKKADLPSRSPFDLPAASGGDDSTVINAIIALAAAAGGGVVRARQGADYEIENTILLKSGVTLDLSGSAITNVAAAAIRMISNEAMLEAGASCTVAWTAGLEATVTQTAHGYAEGDYAWLRGADQAQFRGVFRVVDVPTAGTYVVQLWRTPEEAATGTITAVKADTDITLIGADLDYNYPTVPIGVGYLNIPTYFAGAANLRIEKHRTVNALKMAVTVGSVNGFVIDGVHNAHTLGDAVKIYGPATGGQISNIFGYTFDDFCSVHPREYDVFVGYQISDGDVIGIQVSNLNGRTQNAKMFVMYATDTGPIIDGIQVDGVHGGPSAASFGAVISAHCYAPEAQGAIGSCVIRNVTACGPRVFDSINCEIGRVELGLAGCRPIDPAAQFMLIDADSIIHKMIVSGRAETGGLTTGRFMDLAGCTIDHLVFDKLQCAVPGYFLTTTVADTALAKVSILGCDLGQAGKVLLRFYDAFAATPAITIADSRITALHAIETHTPVTIDVNNTDLTLSGYVVNGLNPPSGNTTIRVSTRNARKTGGGWIEGASNVKYQIFSADISEPVNGSIFERVDGAFMHNPTTGIGTITEPGIVDCHGTASNSWRVRGDPVAQRY